MNLQEWKKKYRFIDYDAVAKAVFRECGLEEVEKLLNHLGIDRYIECVELGNFNLSNPISYVNLTFSLNGGNYKFGAKYQIGNDAWTIRLTDSARQKRKERDLPPSEYHSICFLHDIELESFIRDYCY